MAQRRIQKNHNITTSGAKKQQTNHQNEQTNKQTNKQNKKTNKQTQGSTSLQLQSFISHTSTHPARVSSLAKADGTSGY
jgi:hypothetical protein